MNHIMNSSLLYIAIKLKIQVRLIPQIVTLTVHMVYININIYIYILPNYGAPGPYYNIYRAPCRALVGLQHPPKRSMEKLVRATVERPRKCLG